ncbi:hypothetical protein RB195_009820 [Necator americanus]|uniref:Uncharacterized protein n=1 Tax=Necator americanus TaxID=51031 RepID=A0ABR1CVV3_NECAM
MLLDPNTQWASRFPYIIVTAQARYPSRRPNVVDGPEKIPFCLPYISDDMSRAVRGCLRKAGLRNDVRVVEIPPANLKEKLVRNRVYDRLCTTPSCVVCPYGREGDCMISGVVYRITCRLCGDDYIGETGRPKGSDEGDTAETLAAV